jgi:hypothetical protein
MTNDTFEQERQEVLDNVFRAFSGFSDHDEMAACAFLMRHLTAEPPEAALRAQSSFGKLRPLPPHFSNRIRPGGQRGRAAHLPV